jgi:hypothetical protein
VGRRVAACCMAHTAWVLLTGAGRLLGVGQHAVWCLAPIHITCCCVVHKRVVDCWINMQISARGGLERVHQGPRMRFQVDVADFMLCFPFHSMLLQAL